VPEMDSGAYQPRRPRRPEACARAEGPVRLVVCKAPFSARAESQEQNNQQDLETRPQNYMRASEYIITTKPPTSSSIRAIRYPLAAAVRGAAAAARRRRRRVYVFTAVQQRTLYMAVLVL
jgi:hypothetical protein